MRTACARYKGKYDFGQLIDRLAKKLKNSSFQMLDGTHNSDSRISRIRPLVHQEALTATKHFIFSDEKDMATCTPEQIYDKFDRYLFSEGGVVTTIKRFKGFEIQNIAGVAAQIHDGM